MATGDIISSDSGGASSITTGGVTFAVHLNPAANAGDLLYVLVVQFNFLAISGVQDLTLGNTFTALTASDTGDGLTGNVFYSIVTNTGTWGNLKITAGNNSGDEYAYIYALIAGPFSAVDKAPSNILDDISSPTLCPATGILAQANELVMSWMVADQGLGTWVPAGPSELIVRIIGSVPVAILASRMVAATTSVTPQFTWTSNNPNTSISGTTTFKVKPPGHPIAKRMGGVKHAGYRRSLGGLWMRE